MKITTALLFLPMFLLTFCQDVAAQRYLPATITFHSGQTESGTIFHGNWIETPQFFRFMNQAGTEQKYGVDELKSVELTRKDGFTEYFECRVVMVNRSSNKLTELETGPAPRMEKDTVFMQTLLRSKINLYLFKEVETEHFFAEKDSLQELVFKQYLKEPNDPTLMKNNRFRQQLLALTIDCPYLREFILNVSYNESAIRKILLEYNKCKETAVEYQFKREKLKIHFYVGVGAVVASLRDIQTDESLLKAFHIIEKEPTVLITPVVGFYFPIPRTNNMFGVKADVSLRNIQYAYGYDYDPDALEKINLTHIRLHTLLQWNAVNRRHKLFLQGGVQNSWLIGNENELTISGGNENAQREYEFGFVIGAGYGLNRFTFDFRYDQGKGYSTTAAITSTNKTFSVFLHYRLF